MYYPTTMPQSGYGQVTISPAVAQALSPAIARAMAQRQQQEQLFPTWAYVAAGVVAVGGIWFFFFRKKAAA